MKLAKEWDALPNTKSTSFLGIDQAVQYLSASEEVQEEIDTKLGQDEHLTVNEIKKLKSEHEKLQASNRSLESLASIQKESYESTINQKENEIFGLSQAIKELRENPQDTKEHKDEIKALENQAREAKEEWEKNRKLANQAKEDIKKRQEQLAELKKLGNEENRKKLAFKAYLKEVDELERVLRRQSERFMTIMHLTQEESYNMNYLTPIKEIITQLFNQSSNLDAIESKSNDVTLIQEVS